MGWIQLLRLAERAKTREEARRILAIARLKQELHTL